MSYEKVYGESIRNPEKFWGEAAKAIQWSRPYSRVFDDSRAPFTRWFLDGELNTCYNAVDFHAEHGRAEQTAVIFDSPVTKSIRRISYGELVGLVARFAGVLAAAGVQKGDTVIIYMPTGPEAVIAMLGCARIGAVHSVVFGGFAPHELALLWKQQVGYR